ncbi:uncharacterized protein LOC134206604 [Armigeres subalbatus]|uniref:uncharacterized protein LOC134206604 n=1 Tax=Armigeres subalbatus TaxID=124917 RepID=UPI002ED18216
MLSSRLDSTTRRDWEEYSSTLQNVTFKQLTAFIQRRVNVLQSINHKVQEFTMSSSAKKPIAARPIASHGASQYNPRKCILCSEHHPLYMCSTFSKMSIEDKEKEIRRHQLCRNCLRRGHLSRECPSNNTCRRCKARHHTQLCDKESSNSTLRACEVPPTRTTTSQASNEQPSTSASATYSQPASYSSTGRKHVRVILATALVHVIDDNGTSHVARALLDSGSECCFASESFSQRLKVQRKKVSILIAGIGQSTTQAKHKFSSTIRSRISSYSTSAEFLVLSKVTANLPSTTLDISSWEIPPEVQLADPSFRTSNTIDIVIEGRYIVRLPLKDDVIINLGENRRTAVRRFHLVESRLLRDHRLGQQYRDFMKEYYELGHMKRVEHNENSICPTYYLPHHAVVREDSTTTKVRVVYDASCKTSSGLGQSYKTI